VHEDSPNGLMTPPKVTQQIEALRAVCSLLKFQSRCDRRLSGSTKEITEEDADLLYGGLLRNPAVKLSRNILLNSDLESSCEGRTNASVDGPKLGADGSHRSDAHDRDKRSDQAVLDRGDAGFVSDKTREEGLHRKDPLLIY
jgi:hypothetical protein